MAALAANHLALGLIGMWPRSRLLGDNILRLPGAAARRGEIAVTFDDGPHPNVTPKVLDILDRYGAKASFFCVGERAAARSRTARAFWIWDADSEGTPFVNVLMTARAGSTPGLP